MRKNRINDDDYRGFRKLSTEGVNWLIENYHSMTTQECAVFLNLKEKTVINYAFRLNLRKSPEHISKMRRKQALNTNEKRWKK